MLNEPVAQEPKPDQKPIKVWCPSCWADRIITKNSKCRTCGNRLITPKHWDTTLKKLDLIINNNGFVPLEIKNRLYLIPYQYIDRYSKIDKTDHSKVGEFVEEIKVKCDSFKI